MIAADTNVPVHAHRPQLESHKRALDWLRHLAEGNAAWAIPVFCLVEFVRVVTHPRILNPPSSLKQALSAFAGLLESPTLRILNPGARYPALFRDALSEAGARGNLAFDAQIVAVCREQGASRILTLDRDFARFSGIRIVSLDQAPTS